jgi:hypothetical protein
VFQYVYVFVFADVSTLTENDERSTIGIKLSWKSDFVSVEVILWRFENFVFSRFRVCLYTILYLLCIFMMVWYGAFRSCIRTRIPTFRRGC